MTSSVSLLSNDEIRAQLAIYREEKKALTNRFEQEQTNLNNGVEESRNRLNTIQTEFENGKIDEKILTELSDLLLENIQLRITRIVQIAVIFNQSIENIDFLMKSLWEQIHPPSPVTIERETQLFEHINKAKTTLSQTSQITYIKKKESCDSKVSNIGEIFFKEDQNVGIEQVIWEMAKIFSVEEFFTPTRLVKATLKNGTIVRGSMQLRQKGIAFKTVREKDVDASLTREGLITGMMICLIFGMFDAHHLNLLFSDGFCFFFDNTASLSHSNSVISWENEIRAAFRSALLRLPGSFTTLTAEEKKFARTFLSKFTNKILLEEFQDLLKFHEFKIHNEKIFNSEQIMIAFSERLNLLQEALVDENDRVNNLRDLVFAVHPGLKFITALTFLYKFADIKKDECVTPLVIQCNYFSWVGFEMLNKMLSRALPCNPQIVLECCEDPTVSFDEIVQEIIAVSKKALTTKIYYDERITIFAKYKSIAKIDDKM